MIAPDYDSVGPLGQSASLIRLVKQPSDLFDHLGYAFEVKDGGAIRPEQRLVICRTFDRS